MGRLRVAVTAFGVAAAMLWGISIAAIWVHVDVQALADARAGAPTLTVLAGLAVKYDRERRDRRDLGEELRDRVRDRVAERLAGAAVTSRRAALGPTRPFGTVR